MERLIIPEGIAVADRKYYGEIITYKLKGTIKLNGDIRNYSDIKEFENKPVTGLKIEQHELSDCIYSIKILDPRGFSFKISNIKSINNLFSRNNIINGEFLGEYIYSWGSGGVLYILNTSSKEYKDVVDFESNLRTITKNDLVIGTKYKLLPKSNYSYSGDEEVVYLGREKWYSIGSNYSYDTYLFLGNSGYHSLKSVTNKLAYPTGKIEDSEVKNQLDRYHSTYTGHGPSLLNPQKIGIIREYTDETTIPEQEELHELLDYLVYSPGKPLPRDIYNRSYIDTNYGGFTGGISFTFLYKHGNEIIELYKNFEASVNGKDYWNFTRDPHTGSILNDKVEEFKQKCIYKEVGKPSIGRILGGAKTVISASYPKTQNPKNIDIDKAAEESVINCVNGSNFATLGLYIEDDVCCDVNFDSYSWCSNRYIPNAQVDATNNLVVWKKKNGN